MNNPNPGTALAKFLPLTGEKKINEFYAINDNGTLLTYAGKFETAQQAQDYIDALDESDDPYLMKVVCLSSDNEFDFIACLEYSDAYSDDEKEELLRVLISEDNPRDFTTDEKEFIFSQYLDSGTVEFLEAEYERHFFVAVVHGGYASEEDFDEVKLQPYREWAISRLTKALKEVTELCS
jgi:hypothetical protein